MARATAAARGGCGSFRFGGFGLGAAAAAALEIRGIPAASLQLETGSGDLLGVALGPTGGTGGERGIAPFLKMVFLMAAGTAAILVDRHDELRKVNWRSLTHRNIGRNRPAPLKVGPEVRVSRRAGGRWRRPMLKPGPRRARVLRAFRDRRWSVARPRRGPAGLRRRGRGRRESEFRDRVFSA